MADREEGKGERILTLSEKLGFLKAITEMNRFMRDKEILIKPLKDHMDSEYQRLYNDVL